MFDRYQYISGFNTRDEAQSYADRLPSRALAKVSLYRDNYHPRISVWKFCVEVDRFFTEPRSAHF